MEGPHAPTHEDHAGSGDHLHDVRVGFQAPPGFYHGGKFLDVPVRPRERNRNRRCKEPLGALSSTDAGFLCFAFFFFRFLEEVYRQLPAAGGVRVKNHFETFSFVS